VAIERSATGPAQGKGTTLKAGIDRRGWVALAVVVLVALVVAVPLASAAPKIDLPPRGTWDVDMINSDIAGNSGAG